MAADNLIFFSMWWIFFRQFNSIGGWNITDMMASMAIITGAYGLKQSCFGNTKNLGLIILSGDLDPFMTQPKNLLVHLSGSKSFPTGWGRLMTSAILIAVGDLGHAIPLIVLASVTGCIIFTAASIMIHSLTFWLGSIEAVSQKYLDSLFVFALYPTNIYSGVLQLVMFTVIPAGLIGYIPVELVRSFSWSKLSLLCGCSLGLLGLSFFLFHLGLKRYESGNQFGMRE